MREKKARERETHTVRVCVTNGSKERGCEEACENRKKCERGNERECVCACMSVCVRESAQVCLRVSKKERERERESECVCVCVFV